MVELLQSYTTKICHGHFHSSLGMCAVNGKTTVILFGVDYFIYFNIRVDTAEAQQKHIVRK